MPQINRNIKRVVLYFILYFLIALYATPLVVYLLAFLVTNYLLGYEMTLEAIMDSSLFSDIGTVLGNVLVILIFARKGYTHLFSSGNPLKSFAEHKSVFLWAVLLELAAIIPINSFVAYLNLSDYNMALASSETVTFLGILAVCVLAPVAEEIIMRGGIEENLLQWKKNPAIAILVSSLLFAVLHLSSSLIIGTFFLGLISGWVYYRTRNVMVCIFMHMSNNIISCLSDWLLPDSISLTDDIYVKILVFVCVAIAVIAILKFNESTRMLRSDRIA